MNAAKKILQTVISVILWIIILLAALFAFTTLATKDTENVASVAGYTPLSVATNSMYPTFSAGDLIIIRRVEPSTLEVGDIITFHTIIENEFALNTHRIESIEPMDNGYRRYVTKGDNNAIADPSIVSTNDIVGKYVAKLPGVGKVMDFLSSSIGFLVVIVLPMLLFFIYQVYHLVMVSISLKKAMAAEDAEKESGGDAEAIRAEAERARQEAQAALEEAKRIKAEAEAKLAEAGDKTEDSAKADEDAASDDSAED